MTSTLQFKNLDVLARWAQQDGAKVAFMGAPAAAPPVDPAAMGMPPGAPPMDPAMMGMPPGAPPIDPAAMGMPPGAPPIDPAMMGAPMPVDPAAQTMADQETTRTMIREEIQKAMGSTDAGPGVASGAKKGNKTDDAIAAIMKKMEEQSKITVAALRKAGVEIPLADFMGVDGSTEQQQGVSEMLQPGQAGGGDGGLVSKVADFARDVEILVRLAQTRDSLKSAAMGNKLIPFNPMLPEKNYFAGLYR